MNSPLVLIAINDSIEIANEEPREAKIGQVGELKPKPTLRMQTIRIVNNRDDPISGMVGRDNKMEGSAGDGNSGNTTKSLIS